MSFMTGKLQIDTPDDAVQLISLLLRRDRPTAELLAAIDENSHLLPAGFDRVRAQLAAGNPGGAQMAMMVALSPDTRR